MALLFIGCLSKYVESILGLISVRNSKFCTPYFRVRIVRRRRNQTNVARWMPKVREHAWCDVKKNGQLKAPFTYRKAITSHQI